MADIPKVPKTPEEIRAAVEARKRDERVAMPPEQEESPAPLSLDFIRNCYNTNNVGEGRLFVALNRSHHRFNVEIKEWLVFRNHFWEIDHLGAAASSAIDKVLLEFARYYEEQLASEIEELRRQKQDARANRLYKEYQGRISRLQSTKGRADVIGIVLKDASIHCVNSDFDQDPWLLPVINGVVDLRTGRHRPGKPDDFCSVHAPTEWLSLDAPCPEWDRFLSQILDGDAEMVAYLKRVLGLAIIGQQMEPDFYLLYGKHGRNGKTTLLETLAKVLGPDLTAAIPIEFFLRQRYNSKGDGPSPNLATMHGKRIVWAVEPDENRSYDVGVIKSLTGGDSVTTRELHKNNFTFTPQLTLFLLSNHLPHASASDGAFWERMRPIDFALSFVIREEKRDQNGTPIPPKLATHQRIADPHLCHKLAREASGILASLVRGCLAWLERGSTAPPPQVLKFLRDYRTGEDILLAFVEENCVEDLTNPAISAPLADLYHRYKEWWEEGNPTKPISKRRFCALLEERFKKFKNNNICFRGVMLDLKKIAGGVDGSSP